MKDFMAQFGARLVDNGYPVIPIMPGAKVPGHFRKGAWAAYPDWTRHCDRPTKTFEIDIWRRWPDCAVGIACGAVVGIDIDVPDASVAVALTDLAKRMLGETPCLRIGQSPKRLLVYRADTVFRGRKRHPLEVLARGQQFVAYAIHPVTGQAYAWPEEGLTDTPLADLPEIAEAACDAFLDAAWDMVPAALRKTTLNMDGPSDTWRGPSDPRGTPEAVAAALAYLPNDDLPGNEWITIGAAIKAAIGEEGRQLWIDWSRNASKSGQSGRSDTPERRWATLKPHSAGAGKIYWLAVNRGWCPPPEIVLNGNAAEQMTKPHPAAGLLAKASALAAPSAPPPAPYRVPPELLQVDGTLRLFLDYANATAISPQPFLALGAGICLVGALAGRRYRTPTDLRSNVYAVGIADSGGGKDHARRCVKRAIFAAKLDRYLGGEELASSAGLLTSLQRHPVRLFQVDEFGQFLKAVLSPRAPTHKAAIWAELTKLYTSAAEPYIGTEYADQKTKPRVTIEQPCACLWGVTVPGPFWAALEGGALGDGSMARFMVFLTDEDYPARDGAPAPMEPPANLVAALTGIARGVPGHSHGGNLADLMGATAPMHAYTVPLTPEAETAMAEIRREATDLLRAHRGTYATALFGRYAENTAKLAMIAAISRDPAEPVTQLRDVTWAGKLVEHCIGTLVREADRFVGVNDNEVRHKKALNVIRDAGSAGITRTKLIEKTHFLGERRDAVFQALCESGQITIEIVKGRTKPTQLYRFVAPEQRQDEEITENPGGELSH
ncbi:MAG: bifunctional DNA primase/polymerase [Roseomonas sp.]|nr:bifunctional DNA primase/polymerase [Roseomonas sp.]MCA3328618.1 bifunctional DNA primase/polymerase [Roseomonas sp.]MCA3335982.1 bifunctional DNA primase/polymerase [Roseomonas sp.]MCA3386947.1 bifunctional DNA primase/polymerase [Roseomonas sp.]MCA3584697.1 bifunctional DNA primase/polymerase [Methylocystis sp.]